MIETPNTTGVTPMQYIERTGCNYQYLADLTGLDYNTVKRWFMGGKSRSNPSPPVLRLLALSLELKEMKNGG